AGGDQEAPVGVPDGGRRFGLPGVEGDPRGQGGRFRRPRHGGDLRIRGQGHAGDRGGRFAGHLRAPDRPARMAGPHRQDPGGRGVSNTRVVNGPGVRICYEDEPGYLRASVFDGTDSLQVSIAMWRMIVSECNAVGATRVLVVEDLRETVDTADFDVLVEAILEAGLGGVRCAFVELRDDIQGSELVEIMLRERGIESPIFSSEDVARRWLVYGS